MYKLCVYFDITINGVLICKLHIFHLGHVRRSAARQNFKQRRDALVLDCCGVCKDMLLHTLNDHPQSRDILSRCKLNLFYNMTSLLSNRLRHIIKSVMTPRVLTFLRENVTSLTTSVTTMQISLKMSTFRQ